MAGSKQTSSKPPRHKWLKRSLYIIGIVIGLALVFNEQIKLFVVDHLGDWTMQQLDAKAVAKNKSRKATFDFDSVKALDMTTVGSAAFNRDLHPIGEISIPSVKMDLPILKGLSNENLSAGAGTMKADQVMGEGNYALAGHYMTNNGILFSPLKGVQKDAKVYVTDLTHVYTYKVTAKTVVDAHQVQWIDDVPGKKLLTLVTCASPTEGEVDRIIVQATLEKTTKATKAYTKMFNFKDSSKS